MCDCETREREREGESAKKTVQTHHTTAVCLPSFDEVQSL